MISEHSKYYLLAYFWMPDSPDAIGAVKNCAQNVDSYFGGSKTGKTRIEALALPEHLTVSDPPRILDFSKKSPTSTCRNFVATYPFAKFLVPIMASSFWNVRKSQFSLPTKSYTPSPGTQREATFTKKSRSGHPADVHHPTQCSKGSINYRAVI